MQPIEICVSDNELVRDAAVLLHMPTQVGYGFPYHVVVASMPPYDKLPEFGLRAGKWRPDAQAAGTPVPDDLSGPGKSCTEQPDHGSAASAWVVPAAIALGEPARSD